MTARSGSSGIWTERLGNKATSSHVTVRSRRAGSRVYIELFLEFAPQKPVGEVQQVINRITASLQQKIRDSHVTVALVDHPVA